MGGSEQARADIGTEAEIKDLNGLMPLEKIIDEAKARRAGQVIEAEVRTIDGTDVYEIEILDEEGKVWELYFNAKTGELISQGEEKNHASPDR